MAKNLKQAVAEFWGNQPKWIFGNSPLKTTKNRKNSPRDAESLI
ncbi:MAG: hypothetical protein Q8P86_04040 [bacterium]|nr:hypothetical protein [bacterium]